MHQEANMEVSGVNSSAASFAPSQQAKTEQAQKPAREDSVEQARAAQREQEREPSPTVNAQGQKVGQIINASA
jgi:hypothetical protein